MPWYGATTTLNPRKIVFLEVLNYKRGKGGILNGIFVDPWAKSLLLCVRYRLRQPGGRFDQWRDGDQFDDHEEGWSVEQTTPTIASRFGRGIDFDAGVVQWQNASFPSWTRGFDSLHPLPLFSEEHVN